MYWYIIFCSLQADLGMITDITGFATQGEGYIRKYWTEKYSLRFSQDGIHYWAGSQVMKQVPIVY